MPASIHEILRQREIADTKEVLEQFLTEKNLILTNPTSGTLQAAQVLNTADICVLLKVDRHFVYRLAETSELRGFKKKGWKFRLQDFQDYVARQVDKRK